MMPKRLAKLATTLGLSALAALGTNTEPAHALSLLGQEVTGEFFLNPVTATSTNFFDPENGKVPDFTFGNSLNVPGNGTNIVPISDNLIEFGYQGSTSLYQANFTGAGVFTVTATAVPFQNGVTTQFSSPGLAGLALTMVGPAAPNNTCSFATSFASPTGPATLAPAATPIGTITCIATMGGSFTSSYTLSPVSTVPEPTSLTLVVLGVAAVIACARRRS